MNVGSFNEFKKRTHHIIVASTHLSCGQYTKLHYCLELALCSGTANACGYALYK